MHLLKPLKDFGSVIATILKLLVGYKHQCTLWMCKFDEPLQRDLILEGERTKEVLKRLKLDPNDYNVTDNVLVTIVETNGFDNSDLNGQTVPIPKSIYNELVKCNGYTVAYNLDISPPVELVLFLYETEDEVKGASASYVQRKIDLINKQTSMESVYGLQ